MLYRIITENKNKDETINLVNNHFDSFTITYSQGFWHSIQENVLIIEICDNIDNQISFGYRVGVLAKLIKIQNNQEAVLIQEIECKSNLI